MSQWDDLSMREKAAMMRVAVRNRMFDIDQIKEAYNNQNRQVSNSEVINPNQYTPSVNLNVNPALDYVGNALESISGYEYEGNPLNKLGIDMSFDLGTTGSSMYPNGVRFVKKFGEGGNKKQSNLQDIAYAIMAGQGNESSSSGTGRSWSDIISSFFNRTDIVKERGKIPNNLSSLYIYGNDLGQYKEKPEWRNVGVEYDDYIEKSGRDPNNIKTYEGNIVQFDGGKYGNNEESVTLPDIITNDQVIQYINNGNNKTFGRYKYVEDGLYGDDVGGYLTRVSNVNGTPMAVHSDIWDFDKDYTKNYEGVPDWQVKALNKVGNPFILKQLTPIIYEDADTWYPKNELEQHMVDSLGILPEVVVTAKAKKKSNGGPINKFYDGGYVDPTMYGMPDQFTPPITYEDYVDPKTPGQLVGKTALQLLDFTGVSSYPDVINSYEEFKKDPGFVNGLLLGLNALSAIPLIGKVGKTGDLVNNVASAIKPAVKQTVKATRAAKGQSTSGKAFNKAVKKAVKKETEKALHDNSLIHQGVLNVNSTIDTLPELFWFTRKGAEMTQDLTTKYLTQPIFNNWLPQTAKSYRTTNAAIDYLNFSRNLGAFADYYNYYYKDNKDIKNNKNNKETK